MDLNNSNLTKRNNKSQQFILGTVQLGMPYGIANTAGQPSVSLARKIVQTAIDAGIYWFDTASGYGTSEQVLGDCLQSRSLSSPPKIITKLPPFLEASGNIQLRSFIEASLERLQIQELACVMLHREEHLDYLTDSFAEQFLQIKENGFTQTLGCSVYTPQKAIEALKHPLIDIVQIPASLFDRRFEKAHIFSLAAQLGKILHIRSALLQGVLCMAPSILPAHLTPLVPYIKKLYSLCEQYKIPPAVLVTQWVTRRYPHAMVLFGAETPEQIIENVQGNDVFFSQALLDELEDLIPPQNPQLLNPALWSNT